jgi:hypothetical protein
VLEKQVEEDSKHREDDKKQNGDKEILRNLK